MNIAHTTICVPAQNLDKAYTFYLDGIGLKLTHEAVTDIDGHVWMLLHHG